MADGSKKGRMRIPWYRKAIYSAILTGVFFGLLEIICYLTGAGSLTIADDPFVGFSSQSPLFEIGKDQAGNEVFKTATNKLRWFNFQSFPIRKPPGTRRIFCMGGSTTYGHPFRDDTSFAGWLREFLPEIDPSTKWEVINAGGISYASYRVAKLMEELAKYQPDLFIVYSAHNEFLERRTYPEMFQQSQIAIESSAWLRRTRTWSLVSKGLQGVKKSFVTHTEPKADRFELKAEVDEMLNHTIGPIDYRRDPDWYHNVLAHYELNLHRMVSIARGCGAKIVFVSPAVNEMNCSPFKSQHRDDLSSEESQRISVLMDELKNNPKAAQPENSLVYWRKAVQLDSKVAEYHYRIGKSLFSLGQYDEAMTSFRQAIQEDVCPLRAVQEITQALGRVSAREQVPLVDFEKRLRRRSQAEFGHAIFGEDYFLDHVHPTIDINRQLSLWILESLQDHRFIQGRSLTSKEIHDALERTTERVLASIDREQHAIAQRNLAKVLHWAGKFEEAIPHARAALKILDDDPESRFVLADCLTNLGQLEEAAEEFERLFASGRDFTKAYEAYGLLLGRLQRHEAAKAYLMLAILRNDKSMPAYFGLGRVHLDLDELSFAEECFAKAKDLEPDFMESHYWLARTKAAQGKHDEAIALLKQVVDRGIREADVYFFYASSLAALGRFEESRSQLKTALVIRPQWSEAEHALQELESKN